MTAPRNLDIRTLDEAIGVMRAIHHSEPRRFATPHHKALILDPAHVDTDECWEVHDIECGLCGWDGTCKALPPLLNLRARVLAEQVNRPTEVTVIGEWLAASADGCTCGGGDGYMHENGCGWEPIVPLRDIGGVTHDVGWAVKWAPDTSEDGVEYEPHDSAAQARKVHHLYPTLTTVVSRPVLYGPWTDLPPYPVPCDRTDAHHHHPEDHPGDGCRAYEGAADPEVCPCTVSCTAVQP